MVSHKAPAKIASGIRSFYRSDEENVRVGKRANGSCSDMSAFRPSFRLVIDSRSDESARKRVGKIAIDRVSSTRFHFTQ